MNQSIKVFIFILLIAAVIVTSGILTQNYLTRSSKDLEDKLSAIEGYTTTNNWVKAEQGLKEVDSNWSNVKNKWSILIDHQEIDNIDITLKRMEKLIQSKDTPSALAEAAVLINYVKHIPRKEAPEIENIL
jgi:hypothetical protein